MEFLNENIVLGFYLERLEKEEISFLKDKKRYTKEVRDNIEALIEAKEMHQKIEIAKKLWKVLFEGAMSFIDPDKRGYDRLFNYFDKYVEFEELIFASDSFYRDHTLHCLWVYFLGEYFKSKEEFAPLMVEFGENMEENRIMKSLKICSDKWIEESEHPGKRAYELKFLAEAMIKTEKYFEATRCLAALTHDLGYPLKKIGKINKCINGILPHFCINDSDEYDFKYSDIQQNYIEELIRFLAMDIGVYVKVEEEKCDVDEADYLKSIHNKIHGITTGESMSHLEKLSSEELKCFFKYTKIHSDLSRNTEKELGYFNDFEEYNHGIMSAYVLSKNIRSIAGSGLNYSKMENVNLASLNKKNFIAKKDLLQAVTDHTNANYQIKSLRETSDFLILMDEIEEFSRITRANKNRQFVDEFCKSKIYMDKGYLNIDFVFDNENILNLDPEFAFKGRCKRFLTLFKVSQLKDYLKIKLRCIGRLSYDENIYELEIRRKFANITINGEEQKIPKYLKTKEFYSKEEYMSMK